MDRVTFYFDPALPVVLADVALGARRLVELGEIEIDWRVFSLEVVNRPEGTDAADLEPGSPALRTAVAIAERHGNSAVGSFYAALGRRTFDVAPAGDPTVAIKDSLDEIGLDPGLHDEAVADAATWASVIASTEHVSARIGKLGVPTIALGDEDGPMIFGPVISELPDDAESIELWQHTAWLLRNENFHELKRSNRTPPDLEMVRWWAAQARGQGRLTQDQPSATTGTRLRLGGAVAAVVAVVAFGFWFTDLQPFTDGATVALAIPVVILIAIAEARRFRSRRSTPASATREMPRFRVAVVTWSAIVAVATAWELLALRSSTRSEHPTISSFVESIEQPHVGRVLLFLVWLWLGWTLAS